MQYQTALIVGRFQPFHKGHLYLLRTALEQAKNVVIAIGSSNLQDEKNPLSYEERVEMLELVLEHENLKDRVAKIVPSPDFPEDEKWLQTLLSNAGEFEIALGNNEWTNGVLADAGYEVLTVPYFDREIFQGTYIRELFRTQQEWKERVPEYLHAFLERKLR